MFDNTDTNQIIVLGKIFNSEEERREYFQEELLYDIANSRV